MKATKTSSNSTDPAQPGGVVTLEKLATEPGVDECDVCCDAMPGLLVHDLPEPDVEWLYHHTSTCNYCADQLGKYRTVDDVLDRLCLGESPAPPPFLSGRKRAGYQIVDSPVGPLVVAVSETGLCEVGYAGRRTKDEILKEMSERGFKPEPDTAMSKRVVSELTQYFAGARRSFDVPLDFSGLPPFTRKVLEATAEIPFGGLTTYGALASKIGSPKASRAVGNALGRNPMPIIVPCHRVIASGGKIGGYTGGLEIKQRLLAIEGVAFA